MKVREGIVSFAVVWVLGFVAVLIPTACSGASPAQPTQPVPSPVSFALNQEIDLVPGQHGSLTGTDIQVELLEARGVRQGCFDCPLAARLKVTSKSGNAELKYAFSGGMLRELLEKARRQAAFQLVFVAVKITDAGFTLRIERPETPGSPK